HLQMTHDEAVAVLQSLAAFPVWPVSRDLVLEAIDAKRRFGISLLGCRDHHCRKADGLSDLVHGRSERRTSLRWRDCRQSICWPDALDLCGARVLGVEGAIQSATRR